MNIAAILRVRQQRRAAYRTCFESPSGRDVLKDLAKFCCAHASTFYEGDTHRSAYNEGARGVFLYIQSQRLANEQKLSEQERKQEEEFERMSYE